MPAGTHVLRKPISLLLPGIPRFGQQGVPNALGSSPLSAEASAGPPQPGVPRDWSAPQCRPLGEGPAHWRVFSPVWFIIFSVATLKEDSAYQHGPLIVACGLFTPGSLYGGEGWKRHPNGAIRPNAAQC